MEKKYPITLEKKIELEQEKDQLLHVDLPNTIEQLKAARAQGDLSENADYDAAKNKQGEIERRISEIEDILNNCEIINEKANKKKNGVQIGSVVKITDLSDNTTYTFTVVSTIESNLENNKISNVCPLGAALIGHGVGDIVKVKVDEPYDVQIVEIK